MRLVTYSELQSLFHCPHQHHLNYGRRLTSIRKSPALDEGTAGHAAFDAYYKGATVEKALVPFRDVTANHVKHVVEAGGDAGEMEDRFMRVEALLMAYFQQHGLKDRHVYDFEKVENEFSVPIEDPNGKVVPGVLFAGKLDGVWREKRGRKVRMVVEHKFYASFDPEDHLLHQDLQLTLYALAARLAFKVEVPITLYNVCRKPKNEREEGESMEDFKSRIYQMILEKPGKYFFRLPITRGPQHFDLAREYLYHGAMVILGKTPLPFIYRNFGDHCKFRCSFQKICMDDSNERLVKAFYTVRPKRHQELTTEES